LLVCGTESRGHLAGHSLLAIHANGIDEQGRIIGSQGAIPFIENITIILDRIGLNDLEEIRKLVKKYKDKGEAYPEEPVVVCSPKKKRSSLSVPTSGDVVISEEFVMDSKAGTIYLAESL
jgi:tetrahydromethanopterin S-methyltransferase subunit A